MPGANTSGSTPGGSLAQVVAGQNWKAARVLVGRWWLRHRLTAGDEKATENSGEDSDRGRSRKTFAPPSSTLEIFGGEIAVGVEIPNHLPGLVGPGQVKDHATGLLAAGVGLPDALEVLRVGQLDLGGVDVRIPPPDRSWCRR